MSAIETATQYSINPGLSRLTVRAFASGMLSSFGHNPTLAVRGYSGQMSVVPGNLQQASLHVSVLADSLEVTDEVSQKDRTEIETRMRQEVLETSKYLEIIFESTQISSTPLSDTLYAVTVTGNLTLHGVTRAEAVTAQVTLTGDTLRAYGEFSLRQTDYEIKLVSVAAGALKVKDEVKVTFDITARKQE